MRNDLILTTSDDVSIEAESDVPDSPIAVAILTHPHPLYGGDMHNSVPAALLGALPSARIGAVRFNFRGVGGSSGTHDSGDGERLDVVAAIEFATTFGAPVIGVGYSFGADVVLGVDDSRLAAVVAVAPPLQLLDRTLLSGARGASRPTLVLSPVHDQFRPHADAVEVTADWPGTTVEPIPGTDHFLAGRLDWVAERASSWLVELVTAR